MAMQPYCRRCKHPAHRADCGVDDCGCVRYEPRDLSAAAECQRTWLAYVDFFARNRWVAAPQQRVKAAGHGGATMKAIRGAKAVALRPPQRVEQVRVTLTPVLVTDAKRRRFDVVLAWRLDRIGRNLRHLVLLLEELQAVGVAFVSLNKGIDLGTPAGRLQLHILAALSEFERSRIQERVRAGLQRVRAQGKRLARPPVRLSPERLEAIRDLPRREVARQLGVSRATAQRRLAALRAVR